MGACPGKSGLNFIGNEKAAGLFYHSDGFTWKAGRITENTVTGEDGVKD
jgi:hypothetical protein